MTITSNSYCCKQSKAIKFWSFKIISQNFLVHARKDVVIVTNMLLDISYPKNLDGGSPDIYLYLIFVSKFHMIKN